MKHKFFLSTFFLSVALLGTTFCLGGEWFVAPNGNDTQDGTKDKPFATLKKAQEAVRAAKATDAGPHIVRLSEGTFELTEPLHFDGRDSGTETQPILYIGAGAKTIISGGRTLEGWKKESDDVWSVTLPKEEGRDLYFEQLFVNGRRAVRARTPNNGFFRPQDVRQDIPINTQNPPRRTTNQSIMPVKGDLDFIKTTPKEELRFGQFVVHHHWDVSRRILLGYDEETDYLLMKGEVMKHWNPWRITSLYYIENIRAAFDVPGEWFYDGVNNKVLYRPLSGEQIENCRFIVPRSGLNQLLLFKGTQEQPVSHIRFEKMSFAFTDSPRRKALMQAAELAPAVTGDLDFPGPGQVNPVQAIFWADAVVDIENADSIALLDCEITNIGEYAVWIKNSNRCRIERCALTELGAGGVRIGGRGSSKFNVVDNCIIHRGGRLHASAVAVWLGQGTEDNRVTHNDIGDFYYSAISAGWTWGYSGVAFRNIIEFNRIHDLGQGVLADMGGVYTLGNSQGTRVCNNVIFNIKSYSYGGWGLYPDEGSEGLLMENNLVYDTTDGSFHQHYGRNNTVRNNILAYSTPHQVAVTRVEPHLSVKFENNIIYWSEGTAIGYRADTARVDYGSNLWFQEGGEEVKFREKTHQDWLALGKDVGGKIADPKFVDAKNRDFRLQEDSPALAMGFVPFDFSKAGVYGDGEWIERAKSFVPPVHPEVAPPPKPLPFKLSDGFETERYTPVLNGNGVDEGKRLFRLSKDNPASGEYCLEVAYASGLNAGYNPHLNYGPSYEQGKLRIEFSLRIQENAQFTIECRERPGFTYAVGPLLRLEKGKIFFGGKELTLPINEWVRFEIVASLGEQSTGDWTLTVTMPNGTKTVFDKLAFRNDNWRGIGWFGFTNQARSPEGASYFLDDIVIDNE